MDDKIIATFCLCDDLLQAIHHPQDPQGQMNDAEVMTTALVAALFFRGNHESARTMLKQHGYIPQMLSKSRFSRRLHRIQGIFVILFNLLGHTWKTLNKDSIYIIDSVPIAVCDNIRIRRSKIYSDEKYHGYTASKKRYFYGLKIHLLVTSEGQPVECFLTHGGFGDVDALKYYAYELPDGSMIYADKAYNDYEIEDLLKEVDHIELLPMRKKNAKRAFPPFICFVQHYYRKMVETAGSLIEQLLPKSIHAVTSQGFELKVALFVIAYSLNCYLKLY
jgi:Transposase DDE domain